MKIHEIIEQDAIFDGEPYLAPGGMLIELLNYYAIGGSKRQAFMLRSTGEAPDARRYKVRVTIETEEYQDGL